MPSAPTLFRFTVLDEQAREMVKKAAVQAGPLLWLRDRASVEAVKHAQTPAELLDLAVLAHGLAEPLWQERVRQWGADIVPLIAERLKTSADIADEDERDTLRERLIAALRWQEEAGALALQECFVYLDAYAQSLICVVWGLLGAGARADMMWKYYEETKRRPQRYFVGALWGLIDLKDERAGRALAELLESGRAFYELYGFLALAGDSRAAMPLAARLAQLEADEKEQAWLALAGITQRIGREALLAELDSTFLSPSEHEMLLSIIDRLTSYSADMIKEYFELFYRGRG